MPALAYAVRTECWQDSEPPQWRRRIAIGLAVLLLHGLAFHLLFSFKIPREPFGLAEDQDLFWITLTPPAPETASGDTPPAGNGEPESRDEPEVPAQPPALRPPPMPAPPGSGQIGTGAPSQTPSQEAGPAADALQRYVLCGLPGEQPLWKDDRKPCGMPRPPAAGAPRQPAPSERQKQLNQEFERDLAVQNAPVLLPCFGPSGASLICLVQGAVNGFAFDVGSYADGGDERGCDRRAAGPMSCGSANVLEKMPPTGLRR